MQYTGVIIFMKSICQQFNMVVNAHSLSAILQGLQEPEGIAAHDVYEFLA
jgi:hypothetical protein